MSPDVELVCAVCQQKFLKPYKLRTCKTCSKTCAYKLRKKTKQTEFEPIEKFCIQCNNLFLDTSCKKQVKRCASCISENMVKTRKEKGSYKRTAEQNQKLSDTLQKRYAEGWSPVSLSHRQKLSQLLTLRWKSGEMKLKTKEACLKKYGTESWQASELGRLKLSKMNKGRKMSDAVRRKNSLSQIKRVLRGDVFTRAKGGFREDIGFYVRSNWEANYARILILENKKFEYEPQVFQLTDTCSYIPDFKIDDVYIELKGYMSDVSKMKIDLFREKYPDLKFELIGPQEYEALKSKYKDLINWEGK